MAYDMFAAREMTEAILQLKPVGNFFRSVFFTRPVEEHNTDVIDVDLYKGQRKVAAYTRSSSKSKPLARTQFKTGGFSIPYIKVSRSLEAAQTLLRSAGENIYSNRTPEQRAQEQIAKDLFEMEEAIQRAEELQAAQAIINGLVVIKGEEVDAQIDLQRDAALTFNATTFWDQAGVDIHAQMMAVARLVFQKSGFTPNVAIFSPEAMDVFFKDAGVRALLDNRRIVAGAMDSSVATDPFPGARRYGTFAGYEIWEYHELYLDDADQTEKTLVPAKKVVFASRNMRCVPHYGVIKDFGALIPMRRFAKSIEEQDPSTKTAIVQTAPAFINHDPDATAVMQVLA
jgi:hypothetical protein